MDCNDGLLDEEASRRPKSRSMARDAMTHFLKAYCVLRRRAIVRKVQNDPVRMWPLVRRILSSSTAIYSGVTGAGRELTIQAEILEVCVSAWQATEELFWNEIRSPSPVLVGYCLVGLRGMDSQRLQQLPNELFERQEVIRIYCGPYGGVPKLGQYAREIVESTEYE